MGKMQQFKREIRNSIGKPMAYQLREGFGASLSTVLERVARGHRVHDGEIKEFFEARAGGDDDTRLPEHIAVVAGPTLSPSQKAGRFTAIVPVTGVALYDLEYQPYCFSTRLLANTMNSLAADPTIDSIVMIFDTPGGAVTGTAEAADAIYAARRRKKVTAIVDPLCASAGYWLASQCTEIIAVPSADIGSVGVFMMHADCSKMMEDIGIKPTFIFADDSPFKVEGNAYEPLSQDAFDYYKAEVNEIMSDFVAAIARGRGVKPEAVLKNFGQGRCMTADKAKKAGMIDVVSTMSMALSKLGVQNPADADSRRRRGETEAPADQAVEQPATEDAVDGSGDADESNVEAEITAGAPAFLSADGCEPFVIERVDAEDGKPKFYVGGAWPEKTVFAHGLFKDSPADPMAIAGETITIAVENGAAVYTKMGETAIGDWVCKLAPDSSFTPRQTEADAEQARKAASERRRRQIALHSA